MPFVLGLNRSCLWRREGLSLNSQFFRVIGLKGCVLNSTSGLNYNYMVHKLTIKYLLCSYFVTWKLQCYYRFKYEGETLASIAAVNYALKLIKVLLTCMLNWFATRAVDSIVLKIRQEIALSTKKKQTSNEVAQPSCMGNIEFCINKCSYSTTLDKGNAHWCRLDSLGMKGEPTFS